MREINPRCSKCKGRVGREMMPLISMIGRRFGRLVVTRRGDNSKQGRPQWVCQCDCGSTSLVRGSSLRASTQSCGCLARETAAAIQRTHGLSRSPEFHAWGAMYSRCENKKNASYAHYGARGIKVCRRWQKFENFFADMGRRPSSKHSVGRLDNNGNYTPKNCSWQTIGEQNNNKSTTVLIRFAGKTQTIPQWADELGMKEVTLRARISLRRWPIARALTEAVQNAASKVKE